MEKKFKVIGIGEILWDILPQGKVLGGAPANFAYHASQLGNEGHIISAIGKDELGEEIINSLSGYDINLHIKEVSYPTSTVVVTLNTEGVPSFEICENVAWDYMELDQETRNLALQTDAVCFGSLAMRNDKSKNTIIKFVKTVSDNALKVFDINLRQHFYSKKLINEAIQLSNILKINDDELKIVAELFGYERNEEEICQIILKDYNLLYVVLTKGAKGSIIFSPEEISSLSTPSVKVVDTVGAGDSFTAAFITSILNGETMKIAHKKAVEIAAFVCTKSGAMPKIENTNFY